MSDFPLTITATATLFLGVVCLYLTIVVICHRRKGVIVHGDNNDPVMAKKIRGHANAAEQIPLGLIIPGLNEAMNPAPLALLLAVMLVVGRYSHAYHFTVRKTLIMFRMVSMALTLASYIIGLAGLAFALLS